MRGHCKSWLALIVPSPTLIMLLPANRSPKGPNNIPRNPSFCYFGEFIIVLHTTFINKPDFSSDLTIFMILFITSSEIIIVVTPDQTFSYE